MGLVSPNTISHRTVSLLGSLCQAFSPCPAAQLQVRRIGSWGRSRRSVPWFEKRGPILDPTSQITPLPGSCLCPMLFLSRGKEASKRASKHSPGRSCGGPLPSLPYYYFVSSQGQSVDTEPNSNPVWNCACGLPWLAGSACARLIANPLPGNVHEPWDSSRKPVFAEARERQEFIFSGRAWGGQITGAQSSHGPVPWDTSVWKKPCPGGEEGQGVRQPGACRSPVASMYLISASTCVGRGIGRPAGLRRLATTYLPCFFLCFVPDGLMIRDIDR